VRGCRGAIGQGGLLTGFSLADLGGRAAGGWGSLESVLRELKAAGLDAVAEAPVDQLADPGAALQTCADAGLAVGCLSVQKPLGDRRTVALLAMRDLAARFPTITTVAPLPREQSITVPTTGYDDVRTVALARLALPGVRGIQVDWAVYGPKLAQVALTFGANDLDRVSTVDDPALGRRRTAAEEVRRHIQAAGFSPVEWTRP
jgi:aminodeoxyfutalosine synthase